MLTLPVCSSLCVQRLVHALAQDRCSINVSCLLEWIHVMFAYRGAQDKELGV